MEVWVNVNRCFRFVFCVEQFWNFLSFLPVPPRIVMAKSRGTNCGRSLKVSRCGWRRDSSGSWWSCWIRNIPTSSLITSFWISSRNAKLWCVKTGKQKLRYTQFWIETWWCQRENVMCNFLPGICLQEGHKWLTSCHKFNEVQKPAVLAWDTVSALWLRTQDYNIGKLLLWKIWELT